MKALEMKFIHYCAGSGFPTFLLEERGHNCGGWFFRAGLL